ncbi:DUF3786 domain-containing protein [Chloroflexota bacterium]
MNSKNIAIPTKKYEYGYEFAYQIASEQLASLDNIEQQCLKSVTRYIDDNKVVIQYLNRDYLITIPDATVSPVTGDDALPIRDTILVLHYFIQAKGSPLSNKMITYKELPDGINYYPTFFKRTISHIVNNFGKEPYRLMDAAQILGGIRADYGDVAVTINAFNRVPITLVLWQGDEEFAPDGNILFDSTISDYLPTEDVTILCEIIVWRLIKLLKAGGDNPGTR